MESFHPVQDTSPPGDLSSLGLTWLLLIPVTWASYIKLQWTSVLFFFFSFCQICPVPQMATGPASQGFGEDQMELGM